MRTNNFRLLNRRKGHFYFLLLLFFFYEIKVAEIIGVERRHCRPDSYGLVDKEEKMLLADILILQISTSICALRSKFPELDSLSLQLLYIYTYKHIHVCENSNFMKM